MGQAAINTFKRYYGIELARRLSWCSGGIASLGCDHDPLSFTVAKRDSAAMDHKLQRITKRCQAEQTNRFARYKTHFTQTGRNPIATGDTNDFRGLTWGKHIECEHVTPDVIG